MKADRVDVLDETRVLSTLAPAHYASAFETTIPPGDVRTAQEWARAAWEGAPGPARSFLVTGWIAGLGLRLASRRSPEHVLGWDVFSSTPDAVVLGARSPLITAHNIVEVRGTRLRWTTIVRFERAPARLVWAAATPLHQVLIPRLLGHAAGHTGQTKHRIVTAFQRRINPVLSRLPGQVLLETTGRKSGLPRRTPVGGRRIGQEFWLVSEHGEKSQYVRNIQAEPRVRVRIRGRWHTGVAHLLPQDDARARLRSLPRMNSAAVRALGTDLLTIRVDLDDS